jgi:hypothetical protein
VKYASSARSASIFAATACATIACATQSTATAYTPITGITIESSALVNGYGCGTGSDQVFRYAAVVSYAPIADAAPDAQASGATWTNIFDCFTDGVFENLPVSSSGYQTFVVSIFAYNEKSYAAAGLPSDLGCVPGMPTDGAICVDGSQSVNARDKELASWTATCIATQQQGVPVLAICPPLGTTADASAQDASAPTDAGAAGPDADASDAGLGD